MDFIKNKFINIFFIFFIFVIAFVFSKNAFAYNTNKFSPADVHNAFSVLENPSYPMQGAWQSFKPNKTVLNSVNINFTDNDNTNATTTLKADVRSNLALATDQSLCTATTTITPLSFSPYALSAIFNFVDCKLATSSTYYLWFRASTGGDLIKAIFRNTYSLSDNSMGYYSISNATSSLNSDLFISFNLNDEVTTTPTTPTATTTTCITKTISSSSLISIGSFLDQNDIGKTSSIQGTDENGITYTIENKPNNLFNFVLAILSFALLTSVLFIFFRSKKL